MCNGKVGKYLVSETLLWCCKADLKKCVLHDAIAKGLTAKVGRGCGQALDTLFGTLIVVCFCSSIWAGSRSVLCQSTFLTTPLAASNGWTSILSNTFLRETERKIWKNPLCIPRVMVIINTSFSGAGFNSLLSRAFEYVNCFCYAKYTQAVMYVLHSHVWTQMCSWSFLILCSLSDAPFVLFKLWKKSSCLSFSHFWSTETILEHGHQ